MEEKVFAILAAREFAYCAFQRAFGDEPSSEILSLISGEAGIASFGLFATGSAPGYASALSEFAGKLKEIEGGGEASLDGLRGEYARVLIGPKRLPSSPWEAPHITSERTLFQERTLAVRAFYRSCGVVPERLGNVSDDHIALEMGFLSVLARRARESFEAGDREGLERSLSSSKVFVEQHPLAWVPEYARELSERERGSFYAALACLCAEFIELDAGVVAELLDASAVD